MSPKLKPLRLPLLVEQRRQIDQQSRWPSPDESVELSSVYATTNSSSSEITSPVTPTFSPKAHQRLSSSTSSLDLPLAPHHCPATPISPAASDLDLASSPLPDLAKADSGGREAPATTPSDSNHHDNKTNANNNNNNNNNNATDDDDDDDDDNTAAVAAPTATPPPMAATTPASFADHIGLYRCLCDVPCQHHSSSDGVIGGSIVSYFDYDYDSGFLSDNDLPVDTRHPRKKRFGVTDSPFAGLTSRLGSRLPSIKRWRPSRRLNSRSSPTKNDLVTLELVTSRRPSSRSSSLSASRYPRSDRLRDLSAMPLSPPLSYYGAFDEISLCSAVDMTAEEQVSLERDRSMATTPLLPPLLTDPLGKPPPESPLQSPAVAPSSALTDLPSTPSTAPSHYSQPSLSTKPSMASLRHVNSGLEVSVPLPAILQEHDEWSDRLGHANFIITPLPYELDLITVETIGKFRDDWDAARVNYTKHLVRTGEHYGQTSKIYGLTEAKWAETERRWKMIYDDIIRQSHFSAPGSGLHSRSQSRSRGRGRGRSSSSSLDTVARSPFCDEGLIGLGWPRIDDCLPSAVPQMLESLDAHGKFPGRGDEDIVGPMRRDAVMIRAGGDDVKGRFWRSLADKVGFRK